MKFVRERESDVIARQLNVVSKGRTLFENPRLMLQPQDGARLQIDLGAIAAFFRCKHSSLGVQTQIQVSVFDQGHDP